MTMEACEEIDRVLGDGTAICKNLFLCNRQATEFYLLLMPGDKPFKTKELSAQIGSSRLSFAKSEYMEKYLDITPGSVSVLGLMNTSSLKFTTEDLIGKVIPALKHAPKMVKLGMTES